MTIDTSLNTLGSLPAYSGSGSPGTGSVATVDNMAAVQQAIALSSDASIIVSLGNSIGSDGVIYNAVGVFDSIVDAGTAQNTSTDTTQNQATQALDQGILSGVTSPPTAAGIYNGNGEFTGFDTGPTSQLSALLKSNPNMSDSIVGDLVTQGIVGSLFSTTA